MKEIGGYLELDQQSGTIFHDDAFALNCGRAALAYLIQANNIKKLYIPFFCCDTVSQTCLKYGCETEYYHIDAVFRPVFDKELREDEWLYIVNFYGQLCSDEIEAYHRKFGRVIADYAQDYFRMPVKGVDTIYTCRKFFGVADGAFLYTDSVRHELPQDESFERIRFVLGRFERTASEFYTAASENNELFADQPVKRMSRLTDNLLRAIDYSKVKTCRTRNFEYLHSALGTKNKLVLAIPEGAFMYPMYVENGSVVRKQLAERKIYIPTLWPDVFSVCSTADLEYDYAQNILPLPVDQRYNTEDMARIIEELKNLGGTNNA